MLLIMLWYQPNGINTFTTNGVNTFFISGKQLLLTNQKYYHEITSLNELKCLRF